MPKKPQDMLEFLRRNREELARATPSPPLPQHDPGAKTARPRAEKPAPKRPQSPEKSPEKSPGRPTAGPTAGPTARPAERPAESRPKPRPGGAPGTGLVLALPRQQAWMVAGGAAALLLLVFWIGTKVGGSGENPDNTRLATPSGQAAFWTVRVATFEANEQSRADSVTEAIAAHRASRGLPDLELAIRPLERDGKLVVTIGRWAKDPKDDAQAREVLDYIRRLQDKDTGRPLFAEAYFWQTPR